MDHSYAKICESEKASIKVCSLNLNGLFSKIKYNVFTDYMQNFDILCLTETKTDYIPDSEFPGFKPISLTNNDTMFPHGGIHGIAALIKDELFEKITKIDKITSNCVLWIKIDDYFFDSALLLGIVYMPCENSDYYKNSIFDDLFEDIISLTSEFSLPILPIGDFNARTRLLNEFGVQQPEPLNPDMPYQLESENDKAMLESLSIPIERYNMDKSVNSSGTKLIELCHLTNIYIINGRMGSDATFGDFTCHRVNGRSVIDYAIASAALFPYIAEFYIDTFDKSLSDVHSPICLTLTGRKAPLPVPTSNVPNVRNQASPVIKRKMYCTKWNLGRRAEYEDSFRIDDIDEMSAQLNLCTSSLNQEKVDEMCGKLSGMFLDSAVKIGISKPMYSNQSARPCRRYCKKVWFDENCEKMRKDYLHTKDRVRKEKDPQKKSQCKLELKVKFSKYKKYLKRVQRLHNRSFQKQIRESNLKNPRKYWKLINSADKIVRPADNISLTEFKNHFMNLSWSEEPAGQFDPRTVNHSLNEEINQTITVSEVVFSVKKLKNNKASGIDSIINEFIKSCPQNMLQLVVKFFNIVLESGIVPTDWCIGMIQPLYKNRGNVNNPDNYRGITLLSCIGKLFTAVINARLTFYLEGLGIMGEEQAGFREGYSTTDQCFVLYSLIDFYLFGGQRLYCAFIDYKKAFDLINRSHLWSKLISNGINGKIITVTYNTMYLKFKCQVMC